MLRVDRVDVAPKRPGTENRWDGAEPEARGNAVCSLLAIGANLVSPVSGEGVEGLCGAMIRADQRERFPQDPDLRLRLSAGANVSFESPVTLDLTSHTFAYEFVVPTSAVPADGLRIEVLDDDAKDGGQSIGVTRLTLETLAKAYESPSRLLTTSAGGLALEVVVSPYSPTDIAKRAFPATFDPQRIGKRKLAAGEIVHLRAEGKLQGRRLVRHSSDPTATRTTPHAATTSNKNPSSTLPTPPASRSPAKRPVRRRSRRALRHVHEPVRRRLTGRHQRHGAEEQRGRSRSRDTPGRRRSKSGDGA